MMWCKVMNHCSLWNYTLQLKWFSIERHKYYSVFFETLYENKETIGSILILTHTVKIYQLSSHAAYSLKKDRGLLSHSPLLGQISCSDTISTNSHPKLRFRCSTTGCNTQITYRHSNCSRRLLPALRQCDCFSRVGLFIGHM